MAREIAEDDDDRQPLITVNGVELAGWARRHRKLLIICGVALLVALALFFNPSGGSATAPEPKPATIAANSPTTGDQFRNDLNGAVKRGQAAAANVSLAEQRARDLQNHPDGGQETAQVPPGESANTGSQQTQGGADTAHQQQSAPKQDSGFLMARAMGQDSGHFAAKSEASPQQQIQDLIDKQKALLQKSIENDPVAQPHGPTLTAAPEKPQYNEPAKLAVLPPAPGYYRISMGRTIPGVLLNRIDGEYAGPVKVSVSVPQMSDDNKHLLIPRGGLIIGEAAGVSSQQQKRIAAGFNRLEIIQPDQSITSYDLGKFTGLDQTGATAIGGKVNTHMLSALLWSLPLGAVSGLSMSTANLGASYSGADAYRMGVAESSGQTATQVLGRKTQVYPTITIPFGQRIEVYVAKDIDLPEYKEQL